eukprot:11084294-Alexandrium_andersonii.AAC.1
MSASLVGSEMCIRDRPQELGSPPMPAPPAGHEITGNHALDSKVGIVVPVSYTHLTLPTICSV